MTPLRTIRTAFLLVTLVATAAALAQGGAAGVPGSAPADPDTLAPPENMPRTPPIAPGFGTEAKDQVKEGARVADADKAFLLSAARGSWAELRAANLAAGKTKDDAVKQFAFMIATDHGKTNDELEGLAKSRMLDLGKPDPARMRKVEALQKQGGAAYDRGFLDLMIADHRDAIGLYEKAAASSTDREVQAYAQRTLEPLRTHLAAAEHLRSTLGAKADPAKPG